MHFYVFNKNIKILNFVSFFFSVSGHKCFVCLPPRRVQSDLLELEKMFGSSNLDSIPKCADYNRSTKEDFIRDCPAESSGCLTKFSGKIISKHELGQALYKSDMLLLKIGFQA